MVFLVLRSYRNFEPIIPLLCYASDTYERCKAFVDEYTKTVESGHLYICEVQENVELHADTWKESIRLKI